MGALANSLVLACPSGIIEKGGKNNMCEPQLKLVAVVFMYYCIDVSTYESINVLLE